MTKNSSTKKIALFTSFVVIIIGIFTAFYHDHTMLRHLSVLITHGKLSWLKPLSTDCDVQPKKSTMFSKYKHCFDNNGNVPYHDVKHNVSSMRTILQQAVKDQCPVLIRHPFPDEHCMERLTSAADANPDEVTVRAKTNNPEWMDQNDFLFPKKSFAGKCVLERKSEKIPLSELLAEYREGPSYRFTSFDASLGSEFYSKVWNTDLKFINGKQGTTFLSNYNKTIITAPYHSAFWDSFAYQCIGTKEWKLMTPIDAIQTVRFFHIFTVMKDCNNNTDVMDLSFDVITEPDTLFYFPPHWAHSVRTLPGPTVLLNYRKVDYSTFIGLFNISPSVLLQTITGIIMYKFFYPHLDPEDVTAYYETGILPNGGGREDKFSKLD